MSLMEKEDCKDVGIVIGICLLITAIGIGVGYLLFHKTDAEVVSKLTTTQRQNITIDFLHENYSWRYTECEKYFEIKGRNTVTQMDGK